jgi:flagella basal body P-ring formation protein FlgA
VRVSGPDIASVRRGPLQAVDAARVRDAAARELQARLAERYLRFEVEPLGDAREVIALPEGKLEIRPRAPLASDVLPARLNVWVDLYIEGLHHQSLPVPFTVRAYAQVLSAREMLRPGALLRPQDFTIREAQVAGLADAAVRADTDVAALRVRQPVPAGELLTWRHVAQAPTVSRNQDIIVRLVAGPIELQTAAVATQDGRTGDVIRVRAVENTQTYAARVSGTGTAEALWEGK